MPKQQNCALFFMLPLALSGCEKKAIPPAMMTIAEPAQAQREAERLNQCQKELQALQYIDVKGYNLYQQRFEHLMTGAKQYAALRVKVNSDTQERIDALYHYKVYRLCAEATQAVMIGLADP